MKFKYAPGLPGYGTRGIDGSTGLSGLGMYFSSYDGTTDSITIKSKIIANKILFPIDETLSAGRTYQTGDLFIDKNGKVFRIDLNEINLYKTTNSLLNTSGFLENSGLQTGDDKYDRLSNAYSSSKFLIDIVYTDVAPGNYAINPGESNGGIYSTNSIDYAQVKYVDKAPNSYYPFTVFSTNTNTLNPQDSIALTREELKNVWHLGNLDNGGSVRDVSLALDFKTIYMPTDNLISTGDFILNGAATINGDISTNGTVYGNFLGSVETESLQLDGWLNVVQDVSTFSTNNFFTYAGNNSVVKIFKLVNVSSSNPALIVGSDGENTDLIAEFRSNTNPEISLDTSDTGNSTDAKFQFFGDGDLWIKKDLDASGNINVTNNLVIGGNATIPNVSGNTIFSGSVTASSFSGSLDINDVASGVLGVTYGGTGNSSFTTNAILRGNGTGSLNADSELTFDGAYLTLGNIGANWIRKGNVTSGDSDAYDFYFYGSSFDNVANTVGQGGDGGRIYIRPGTGQNNVAFNEQGGDGGELWLLGGIGGDGNEEGIGGNGGHTRIYGGAGSDGPDYGGNGGDVYIRPGDGGTGTLSNGNDGNIYMLDISTGNGAWTFEIDANGLVRQGSAVSSDERLKKLEGTIKNALTNILELSGYNYKWNELAKTAINSNSQKTEYGLIAQEVESRFPNLVTEVNGLDGSIYKGLRYDRFAPIFVEAIKEQQSQIEELKNIVAQQQEQINQLLNK